jgi:polysaccharide transporter, PST family
LPTSDADRELSTDHLLADLSGRSVRGGAVTVAAQGLKSVFQFGTVVALARLLPPDAFGLIAMVASLGAVLDLVKELGLSAATIRKPDLDHAQVSALFWLNVLAGSSIAAVLFLGAPLVARFYGEPALVAVTRCIALSFLMSGFTVQHWALLRRQMRFLGAAVLDTGSEAVGMTVALALAASGAGYWALVGQRLAAPALVLVGSWTLCRWRPGPPRRATGVGELFRYGTSVTGCNVAAAINRSVDQILIGWLWGAGALGLYERAAKLLMTPVNTINVPLYAVAMPAFSRMVDQEARYRRAFAGLLAKLAMIVLPGAALMATTADWLVRILFGRAWSAAAPLVALFAVAAAYQPLIQTVGLLYLTQNRSRDMLRAALVDTSLCLSSIVAGLPFGVTATTAALVGAGLILRTPVAFVLSSRRGAVRLGDLWAAVRPAMLAAGSVAAAVHLLRLFIGPIAPVPGLALAMIAALMAALGTYCLVPASRRALRELGQTTRAMRRGKPVAQA